MSETAWKWEEPIDGIGPYFCGTRMGGTLIQITAPDGRALFVECRCSPPHENAAKDLNQRRGVVEELVRACNAHDELVAACEDFASLANNAERGSLSSGDIKRGLRALSCKARGALAKVKSDTP